MRGGGVLLPLKHSELPRSGAIQGSGGAVPANAAESTAAEDDKGGSASTEAPPVLLRLLRRR